MIDGDLVNVRGVEQAFFSIPATRLAEKMGNKMMANIIMVGFVTTIANIISMDATRNTVSESVPRGTEEQNIKAFIKGCDYGLATLKGKKKKALGQTGVVS